MCQGIWRNRFCLCNNSSLVITTNFIKVFRSRFLIILYSFIKYFYKFVY